MNNQSAMKPLILWMCIGGTTAQHAPTPAFINKRPYALHHADNDTYSMNMHHDILLGYVLVIFFIINRNCAS